MADAALTPTREKKCWRAFRAAPHEFRFTIIVGALAGVLIGWGVWGAHATWRSSIDATEPTVVAPLNVHYRANGSMLLSGRYIIPVVPGCTRQTSYLMYRPLDPFENEFVNLGMALGGSGIKATSAAFTVYIHVPADLPPGDWNFIMRVYYTCRPMGMVHKAFSTPPVKIAVP